MDDIRIVLEKAKAEKNKRLIRIERAIISILADEGCSVREAREMLDYTNECLLSVTPVEKPETTEDCSCFIGYANGDRVSENGKSVFNLQ